MTSWAAVVTLAVLLLLTPMPAAAQETPRAGGVLKAYSYLPFSFRSS